MSWQLYMDVHVRRAITNALRLRKVDVLTAQEDQSARLVDPALLDRADGLGRVLFSQDDDLLREATARQRDGRPFAGFLLSLRIVPVCGDSQDHRFFDRGYHRLRGWRRVASAFIRAIREIRGQKLLPHILFLRLPRQDLRPSASRSGRSLHRGPRTARAGGGT